MSEDILVVAAHPDDEILGCGATMARHVRDGDRVHVLIMAEGLLSRVDPRVHSEYRGDIKGLRDAAQQANREIGVASLVFEDFPDNRMDSVNLLDVVKVVEATVERLSPSIVYTHFGWDLNIDHRKVSEAVMTACRPLPGGRVRRILQFEAVSSTEWQAPGQYMAFQPNWFVDTSETLAIKLEALAAYQQEMRAWPHSRSIEAVEQLARWRGASVGLEAAEAFILARNLERPCMGDVQ